jgi:hypothetical protein
MDFTPEEKESIKKMLLFLVKKKHKTSGGHCGFHPMELLENLEELVQEEKIQARDTIHARRYFLITNTNSNGH